MADASNLRDKVAIVGAGHTEFSKNSGVTTLSLALEAGHKAIMDAGFKASMEVFAEHEAKSPEFKKIHQDMRAFQRDQILWNRFSEFPFNQYMNSVKI